MRALPPQVLNARVYDLAIESPLQYAYNLSSMVGNQVWLKREDLQPVFSFKVRGAYNKLIHLSREQMQTGVVACSAGNHAQGVALSASKLGIPATIVMPLATPEIKASSTRPRRCLLYTSPSPRDGLLSRMPSSA